MAASRHLGKVGEDSLEPTEWQMKNPIFAAPDLLDTIRVFALKMVGKKVTTIFSDGYFIVISHK